MGASFKSGIQEKVAEGRQCACGQTLGFKSWCHHLRAREPEATDVNSECPTDTRVGGDSSSCLRAVWVRELMYVKG